MASSLYKAQSALRICEIHDRKELVSFCRTCNIPICTQCVKADHIQHDWDDIKTVARERRQRLPTLCRKIKSENLQKTRQLLEDSEKPDDEDPDIRKINPKKEALIENIKILVSKKIERKRRHLSSEERKKIDASLKYLEKMTTELDVNVGTFSDFDVLEMEQEMTKELEALQLFDIRKTEDSTIFVPGEMDLELLEEMIGQFHDPSAIEINKINSFSFDDLRSYGICAVKGLKAWVSNKRNNELYSIDSCGEKVKQLKVDTYHFVLHQSGQFIITDKEEKTVKILTNEGKSCILQHTSPLVPTCISLTNDQNILINLRDDGKFFELTDESRRLVQKIDLEGEVLQSFEFVGHSKTRLFTMPYHTNENRNGDICVVNRMSDTMGELITLKSNGKVRFRYRGLSDPKYFDPLGIACDSEKHILVVNHTDKSVHVLAYDGTFLKQLLLGLTSRPMALSLYEDKLWLTCEDSTAHIYSLKSRAVMR